MEILFVIKNFLSKIKYLRHSFSADASTLGIFLWMMPMLSHIVQGIPTVQDTYTLHPYSFHGVAPFPTVAKYYDSCIRCNLCLLVRD